VHGTGAARHYDAGAETVQRGDDGASARATCARAEAATAA